LPGTPVPAAPLAGSALAAPKGLAPDIGVEPAPEPSTGIPASLTAPPLAGNAASATTIQLGDVTLL
jgi:hypothetical protein